MVSTVNRPLRLTVGFEREKAHGWKSPNRGYPPSLLFHELVHVVQYSLLGLDSFVEQYVLGWVQSGGTYEHIPLERLAFDLEGRYTSQAHVFFSVEVEVRRLLPPA